MPTHKRLACQTATQREQDTKHKRYAAGAEDSNSKSPAPEASLSPMPRKVSEMSPRRQAVLALVLGTALLYAALYVRRHPRSGRAPRADRRPNRLVEMTGRIPAEWHEIAQRRPVSGKEKVTLRLETDVLKFFRTTLDRLPKHPKLEGAGLLVLRREVWQVLVDV